ncbi:MAG: hypothetical protein ACK55V_09780 [Alphaproteobacteria bacterium]
MSARGQKTRLSPQDAYTHVPDKAQCCNRSMDLNVFDPMKKIGRWFGLGNRRHEGYGR